VNGHLISHRSLSYTGDEPFHLDDALSGKGRWQKGTIGNLLAQVEET
jgi:hypothetical protein